MPTLFPIFEIRFLPLLMAFLLSVAFAIALVLYVACSGSASALPLCSFSWAYTT
jgi:hypothetical protein